ncbi:MAG: hypothetical protein ACKOGN_06025 [Gammaproteobacteria bacterium]|jgi:hypothetical protein
MLQQLLVIGFVVLAALYVFWTLAGNRLRVNTLKVLQRVLPPLARPLARVQRDLEAPTGCSACRSNNS